MTRGEKSSEHKACYRAFWASCLIGLVGVYLKSDLMGLGVLIGAITAPLMWYAGARTALKRKIGEE